MKAGDCFEKCEKEKDLKSVCQKWTYVSVKKKKNAAKTQLLCRKNKHLVYLNPGDSLV